MNKKEREFQNWIKECGFNEKMFISEKVELLQAQRIATNLIKKNHKACTENEVITIQKFLKNMSNSNKRQKITNQNCYQIMNIGKRVNRQEYRQHKKLKQAFK